MAFGTMHVLASPRLRRALARGGDIHFVDGGLVSLPAAGTPHDLGGTVAGAVAGGLLAATRTPGGRVR